MLGFDMLSICEEILHLVGYDAGKREHCYHIRDCHESVEDVSDGPDSRYGHIRACKDSCDIEPTENMYSLLVTVCQIGKTTLRIIIPA